MHQFKYPEEALFDISCVTPPTLPVIMPFLHTKKAVVLIRTGQVTFNGFLATPRVITEHVMGLCKGRFLVILNWKLYLNDKL